MKNLLITLLFLGMIFWSFEVEEATSDAGNDSIIGSWNFSASEYDSTCTDADTVNITINGNNATFNDFYTDCYYPEYSHCNVIELVR